MSVPTVLAAINSYGSNAGLIDAGTAVILQTPSSSQGEPSAERSVVPLVEGSTVPPVLPSSDPGSAPLRASSIVDEEAPALWEPKFTPSITINNNGGKPCKPVFP